MSQEQKKSVGEKKEEHYKENQHRSQDTASTPTRKRTIYAAPTPEKKQKLESDLARLAKISQRPMITIQPKLAKTKPKLEDIIKEFAHAGGPEGEAEFRVAKYCLYGGHRNIHTNVKQAANLFLRAIDKGYLKAKFHLGLCYEYGRDGLNKNPQAAVKYYEEAAGHGFSEAMYRMAVHFEKGEWALPQNFKKAVDWYTKAASADKPSPEAMYRLGAWHEHGEHNYPKNVTEAIKLYRTAAKEGYPEAQYYLSICYFEGQCGAGQDEDRAKRWLKRAAKQNYAEAQFDLGLYYMEKRDIKLNRRAKYWFEQAAKNGNTLAPFKLIELQKDNSSPINKNLPPLPL